MRGMDTQTGESTENYFEVDGEPLGERNPKWLNNDYVKFIRFAQWRIERTGYGVLAYITDHSYLDSPTFRGMRQSLMRTFDEIFILDLHGNSRKKEVTPSGGIDKNVFDIQQGVTISIFVRRPKGQPEATTVRHADLWGVREIWEDRSEEQPVLVGGKYHWLWNNQIDRTDWKVIQPRPPYYLFVPQDIRLEKEYLRGWKITDAMPECSVGTTTGRDKLCVSFSKNEGLEKIEEFIADHTTDYFKRKFNVSNKSGWSIDTARDELRKIGFSASKIHQYSYRPFDDRVIYFDNAIVGRSRFKVMTHMLAGENIALCTSRQVNGEFRHTFCSKNMIDDCFISIATRERAYIFPLYLYHRDKTAEDLFANGQSKESINESQSNFANEFIEDLAAHLWRKFVFEQTVICQEEFGSAEVFSPILHSY